MDQVERTGVVEEVLARTSFHHPLELQRLLEKLSLN